MKTISICAKCSDLFNASLCEDGKLIGEYDGYVPGFFPGDHYGDYVELKIDIATGKILNWCPPRGSDLSIFKKPDERDF